MRSGVARGVDELTVILTGPDSDMHSLGVWAPRFLLVGRSGQPGWGEFDPLLGDQYPRTVTLWCGGGLVLTACGS
ncbi:hypothetical protein GCM10009764_28640 [Nocardia ninae]|uniref:Uncharacterized protein n=1 Tax=Nocardia ninae NBRC 108245 TaxID=1210091 RepID=A0A511MQP8_9NOCA|nr:hypothetical protein NN4_68450 [Nocardia ninae NBRC 108245]